MRFILCIALLFTTVAHAEEEATRAEHMKVCALRSEMAGLIMKFRQNGKPAVEMMNFVGGDAFNQVLVEVAYRRPRFHTEDAKQTEVVEFSNAAYIACLDRIPKDAR